MTPHTHLAADEVLQYLQCSLACGGLCVRRERQHGHEETKRGQAAAAQQRADQLRACLPDKVGLQRRQALMTCFTEMLGATAASAALLAFPLTGSQ